MAQTKLRKEQIANPYDSDILFTDNVTNNADSDQHGFLPALSGDSDTYLDGKGAWGTPAGGSGLTSSVTTLTPTTGNDTATVTDDINYHFADVSGMTADRNFTVPAGVAKQEIILNITTGDDTYEYVIIGDTGISINGGTAATEWSRLFITGESIRLVATSTSNWQVVDDGRIRCKAKMALSAADTTNSAATETVPTWDSAPVNQGNIADLGNGQFVVRRAGTLKVGGAYRPNSSVADQKYIYWVIKQNGTDVVGTLSRQSKTGGSSITVPGNQTEISVAVGDTIKFYYASEDANMGISDNIFTQFWVEEI